MKKTKTFDKVKEAELKLKSDEMQSNKESLEKYHELEADINGVIYELKEDQKEIKKKSI